MKPVNFGIVGCGVIGTVHIKSVAPLPEVNVVAVCDIRQDVAEATAKEFALEKAYTDPDDLFADPDIEAVVLALPAHARTDLARRAFAQGKHVLTEKPVAMNANEVRQLIKARGTLAAGCCSSRFHFLEASRVVTDFIATGVLGDLRVMRCRAIKPLGPPPDKMPPDWRLSKSLNGGGIMSNWGCYDLDYLLGITGWSLKPETVVGQTWTIAPEFEAHVAPNSDAETHLTAHIRFEGGAILTYERGEYVAAQADEAWEIIGSRGALRLQMTPGQEKVIGYQIADPEAGLQSQILWQGHDSYATIHQGPMQDFAQAIRQGRPPQTSLERALIIQQITDAIYASAEEGVPVKLEVR